MKQEILKTADGSHTLFVKELNEQYHSLNGAITEALHVYIENGFLFRNAKKATVFEVGFGTGLNCLLTCLKSNEKGIKVRYISVEKFPLDLTLIRSLNYPEIIGEEAGLAWERIHKAYWGQWTRINKNFELLKMNTDLTDLRFTENIPFFDVIYFDAFGPDKQPEMWEQEIFALIAQNSNPGSIITTYSAKGEVRRRMLNAGFCMEKLPGPPGKKEMLRGIMAD